MSAGRARRRGWRAGLVAGIAFSLAVPYLAAGEEAERLVAKGLELYGEAQRLEERTARMAAFERALRLFVEAAEVGPANAELLANAGTAALQAERLGTAVLAFRRALALDPDHPRALRNLAHARALLPEWVPRPEPEGVLDTFFFWHRSLSAAERRGAAALAFLLSALALALGLRWPSGLLRGLALVLGVGWIALLGSLLVDARSSAARAAVVIAPETVLRAADSARAPARLDEPLPSGAEVELLEQRDSWSRVRLANGREGWVNGGSLERVAAAAAAAATD